MADYDSEDVRNQTTGMQTNPYAGYNYGGYPSSQGYNYNYPYNYGAQGGYVEGTAQQPYQPAGPSGAAGISPSMYQQLPEQSSYIENILRLNKGKVATVYMSFENKAEWSSKVFKGTIEAAGKDHIILKDVNSEKRYLLLMIYLDYITFEGEVNYFYPYAQLYSVGNV
ncbi:MAG TPA: spore coat protein GerQ [Bacillales bacterium]